jgi:thiol-disulfide isomerase/thioredoxin
MHKRILLIALTLSGVMMIGLQIRFKPHPTADEINTSARQFIEPRLWRERLAPEFELTTLDGTTVKLSDHIGKKTVVLNFFATWCVPCRSEMPELERYAQAHASEPFLLLGIDAEEKRETVAKFVRDLKTTFAVVIDDSGDVLKKYGVAAFPTTVVIGADGRIKLYEVGAIANADVSLQPIVAPELTRLARGEGVSLEAYRNALAAQAPVPSAEPEPEQPTDQLEGRAREIAQQMGCPCGCDDKVSVCTCQTSKAIRAKLRQGGFDGKTNEQVIKELNAEFCGRGM